MAPLRLGEQPTNSETTSIDAFCSAGMSYKKWRRSQQLEESEFMGFKGVMRVKHGRGTLQGSQLIACEGKHFISFYSIITASHQQFIWCSIVERLEHLVLSVYCFPSYCLLTPLMSPKDKKC